MSYSLHALRGFYRGLYRGLVIMGLKGGTRSLDYGSYETMYLEPKSG